MAKCETCKNVQNAPESVPYIVHESSMARMERQIKRLWVALIVCLTMILACNVAWLVYESQFETFYYEQDGEGTNIIGDGNDVNNGAESKVQEEEENVK